MNNRMVLEPIWALYFQRGYGTPPARILRFLHQSQYWGRERMDRYQTDQLNRLLKSAVGGSSFYREFYRGHGTQLDKACDLSAFPDLTKDIIRENSQGMLNKVRSGRSFERTTSGSTGDPLTVRISTEAQVFRKAGEYRFYDWWGIRPYDRNILIWAKKAVPGQLNGVSVFKGIKNFIRSNTIDRTFFIDVFNLQPSTVREYYDRSMAYKPVYLRGYMSGVLKYAELIEEAGLDGSRLNLKLIIVTAEMLNDDQRSYIEKVFACPVANEYGSAEAGLFGFDCPNRKMHMFEEAVFMLPLPDGRLSVTEYHNAAMPLINYINNDSISLSDETCSCGRSLKVIDRINGRISDFVLTSHGEKLSSRIFSYAFNELNDFGFNRCVKKFKVIQKGSILEIFIVKDKEFRDGALTYLTNRIKSVLGHETDIRYCFVNDIEREKSGKLRYFVQETVQ